MVGLYRETPYYSVVLTNQPPPPSTERRLSHFLFLGWLLTWLSIQLSDLPVKLLLKNRFHLGAGDVAFFGLAVGLAWYAKPLFGWLSDTVRFCGTRRRHYLLLSTLLAGGVWLTMAVLPLSYRLLFVGFLLLNAMKTLMSTVLGGVLVDTGQRFGSTGRLSAQRSAVTNVVVLIGGPVGGWLAGRAFGWTAVLSGLCAFGLAAACYFLYQEPKGEVTVKSKGLVSRSQLRELLHSRSLWWGLAMSFLFNIAPGFGTPLLYVQQDVLHFTPQFIGMLAMLHGGAGLGGALLYNALCRHIPLRRLIVLGTVASVAATFLFLWYENAIWAIVVTLLTGVTGSLSGLPVADLTARATPRGNEALGYSLMVSASNVAWKFSDVLGSWLYQHKHFHFPNLVWLNALTSLAVLAILPFIPRSLTDQHD